MSKLSPHKEGRSLRVGIYGGTFDPVHVGHLLLATDAFDQLGLDTVLFVPCGQSPHKIGKQSASAKDRLAMLRVALKGLPQFQVSTCEIDRPTPSYAIDTARIIEASFPGAKLFWLIGADQLPKLTTWERYGELKKVVTFAVMDRGAKTGRLPPGVIRLPQSRRIDLSASEVRDRVRRKLSTIPLVPEPVATYIVRNHLYY